MALKSFTVNGNGVEDKTCTATAGVDTLELVRESGGDSLNPIFAYRASPGWVDGGVGWGTSSRWYVKTIAFEGETKWCVGTQDDFARWTGQSWERQPSNWSLRMMTFSRDGVRWCVGTQFNTGKWDGGRWHDPGYGSKSKMIAFDTKNAMWCVDLDSNILKLEGSNWQPHDEYSRSGWQFEMIAFDAQNNMWCINTRGMVGKWGSQGWAEQPQYSSGGWNPRWLAFQGNDLWCANVDYSVARWSLDHQISRQLIAGHYDIPTGTAYRISPDAPDGDYTLSATGYHSRGRGSSGTLNVGHAGGRHPKH